MRRRTSLKVSVVGVLAVLAAALVACVPPAGGVVGLGVHRGSISTISPANFYYDGTAGDRLNVWSVEGDGTIDGSQVHQVTIRNPDGTVLTPIRQAPPVSRTVELPTTGRYRIQLTVPPTFLDILPITLALSLDEHRGPASLGTLETPLYTGQMLTWTWDGTAGDRLNVFRATLRDPGGVPVPENGELRGQVTLPETGTYTVEVLLAFAALSEDIDGGTIDLGLTTTPPLLPDQHISYQYSGTAGEAIGMRADSSEIHRIVDPGGAVVKPDGASTQRVVLPSTGNYRVILTKGAFPRLAQAVDLWVGGDVDAGPISAGVTTTPGIDPGQSVSYSYAGTAGEQLWVRTIRFLPWPPTGGGMPNITMAVFAPDGSPVTGSHVDDGTHSWLVHDLATSGTHRVVLTPLAPRPPIEVGIHSVPPP